METPEIICKQLFINNQFVDAIGGKTFETINPTTGKVITRVAEAEKADVDLAVSAAKAAFELGSPWRRMDAAARGRLIYKLADLMERDACYLAALESLDNGKPLMLSTHVDVPASIANYRYMAGWTDKNHGKTIPVSGDFMCYTRHEPVGVVGQIIPWNFPLLMQTMKFAAALATGCTMVMKLAEQTPLTGLYMAKLVLEAGFPPGVINILSGFGPECGAHLVNHPDVDKIAFTGSTEVGRLIGAATGAQIKRCSLELGGKGAVIVLDDLKGDDLDHAVQVAHNSLFFNQGQVCCAGSRTYVQEGIYDEFIKRSIALAEKVKVGDPFDVSTNQGPQVDLTQFEKVLELVESGKTEGAKCEIGGQRHGTEGYFVQPTIFSGVDETMRICKEEIFGPVMQILKFKTIDEVIKRANSSNYGLGGTVCTKNIDNALQISNSLRAGTVWVNCALQSDPGAPFGGYKDSGIGREQSEYVLAHYTEVKAVFIAIPQKNS